MDPPGCFGPSRAAASLLPRPASANPLRLCCAARLPQPPAMPPRSHALSATRIRQPLLLRRLSLTPRRTPIVAPLAARDDVGQLAVERRDVDPFIAAALRLQSLIRGAGSGEEELMDKMMAEEPPEDKLRTSAALGGLMCGAAAITVALCTKDPWLGAEHTGVDASVSWAALGALAGLPLVWLKQWSWSPAATQSLPALEDMHRTRLQMVAPWLQRMSRAHVAAVMACEVLPMTLLLLPAAQSVIAAWSSVAASLPPLGPAVQETAAGGGEPRETLVRLVGLLLTATLAAICQGTELSPSEEEFEVIQAAVDNSDRYYRLTTMSVGSRQEDAEHAALAFRCVSQVYLETRGDAALLAGAFTFLEVLFLGGLWYLAGMNVAAPAAAAMAIASVDYYHLHQAVEGSGGQGQ